MKTQLDEHGRIELPARVQKELGVKPGDEITLEQNNGNWMIKPLEEDDGLRWEGNILVHCGESAERPESILHDIREARFSEFSQGAE